MIKQPFRRILACGTLSTQSKMDSNKDKSAQNLTIEGHLAPKQSRWISRKAHCMHRNGFLSHQTFQRSTEKHGDQNRKTE